MLITILCYMPYTERRAQLEEWRYIGTRALTSVNLAAATLASYLHCRACRAVGDHAQQQLLGADAAFAVNSLEVWPKPWTEVARPERVVPGQQTVDWGQVARILTSSYRAATACDCLCCALRITTIWRSTQAEHACVGAALAAAGTEGTSGAATPHDCVKAKELGPIDNRVGQHSRGRAKRRRAAERSDALARLMRGVSEVCSGAPGS